MTRSPLFPLLVAAAGLATFSLMDVAMKHLVIAIGAFDAIFWRNLVGATIMGVAFLVQRTGMPAPYVLRIHAMRSLVVAPMSFLFFWSLQHLPLAEAIALSFIAPVIALLLAGWMLGERVGPRIWAASALALAGVGVLLAEKIAGSYAPDALWGAAAVLASAVLYALNLVLARRQAQAAKPVEIAFFQMGIVSILYLPAAPLLSSLPPPDAWPWLLAAALLALISLLLLSWANARVEAKRLIPVEYSALIWAALFGWIFFAEPLGPATVIGAALIVAGNIFAARAKA